MKTKSLYFSNRKEYYRRKKISIALKKYHSNKRIVKEQQKPKFLSRRLRTQVVYNSEYNISLRAIVINGKQTLDELRKILDKESIKFGQLPLYETEGTELNRPIDDTEDKNLTDGKVYIESFIRGKVITKTI